jgi:hypothetical protein
LFLVESTVISIDGRRCLIYKLSPYDRKKGRRSRVAAKGRLFAMKKISKP